tara:strand:- start:2606 stop:3250 length:645 start_codon:yes stop_codon:yes gene_type:complete
MDYAAVASIDEQNVQEQTRVAGELGSKRVETKTKVHDVIQEFNKKREEGASMINKWKSGLGLLALGVGMATGMGPLALAAAGAAGTGVGGLIGKGKARKEFKDFDYFNQASDDFLKKTDADLYKDMASSAFTGYMGGAGIAKGGGKTGWEGIKHGIGGITGVTPSGEGAITLKDALTKGGASISQLYQHFKTPIETYLQKSYATSEDDSYSDYM